MAAKKRDWEAIKAEYLRGSGAPELAKRYKVPQATIESKASREKWGRDRKAVASHVQAELPGEVARQTLVDATTAAATHLDWWNTLASKAIAMAAASTKPSELKDLAEALKKATEGQRLALGLEAKGAEPPKPPAPEGTSPDDLKHLDPAELERRYRDALGSAGARKPRP